MRSEPRSKVSSVLTEEGLKAVEPGAPLGATTLRPAKFAGAATFGTCQPYAPNRFGGPFGIALKLYRIRAVAKIVPRYGGNFWPTFVSFQFLNANER
jgi:hypothetical protein